MLKNYLKLVLRNILNQKTFSFINIFGLTIGLTCCMMISFYILHQYSYDDYQKNRDRIYQLGQITGPKGESEPSATVPAAMANAMKEEFPEIKETTRLLKLWDDDKTLLTYYENGFDSQPFYESEGYIADANFFEVFTYDFVEGSTRETLKTPNTIVISENIANKLFGKKPALDKQIEVSSSTNGTQLYTVKGVFREGAKPSHINASFFLSVHGGGLENFITESTTMVNNNMFYTYLLIRKNAKIGDLKSKLPSFVDLYMREELASRNSESELFVTALPEIHLESSITNNVTQATSKKYIYILGSIAILTIIIACINFMNLSTSRSTKRSVEVGVRKVLGAERKLLIWQFLGESLIMSIFAFLLSVGLIQLLLPTFEQLIAIEILLGLNQKIFLYLFFFLLAILTGLLAGSYPAFYLSSFKPIKVLKGKFSNSFAALSVRKVLVTFQFVISVVLIVASVVISKQMNFLESSDLGFEKDQQLVIPLRSTSSKENYETLKKELLSSSSIQSVGASETYPGIANVTDWIMYKEGKTMKDGEQLYINRIDENYFQTLKIKSIAGRLFSREFPGDAENGFILNKKAALEMGFSSAEDAVGKWVAFDWEGDQIRFNVLGVIENFHFKDLRSEIEPHGFLLNNPARNNYMIAHLTNANLKRDLNFIENKWNEIVKQPFDYSFMDEDFQKNYETENRLNNIIQIFTILAIFISCLGLFGLATFSAEQRIKEIGLRKVLGASIPNLVFLISFDFLKLVLLAFVIASPFAWFVMNKWLQNFAYRIDINWQIFVIAIIITAFIAITTVSWQSIRAALSNPVKNLRNE